MANIKPLTGKFGDFSGIVLKAAARGDLPAVRHYLKVNPGWLNQEGPHGRTLLWEAANKGRIDVVRELLKRGADVSPLGCYFTPMLVELSPLALARAAGRTELQDLLKRHGATDDIYAACHRGDLDAINAFLDTDSALVNVPSRVGDHPYMGAHPAHYAVAGNQLPALQTLVERGADLNDHFALLFEWSHASPGITRFLKTLTGGRKVRRKPTVQQKKALRKKVAAIDRPNRMGFPAIVEACRGNHNAPDVPERVHAILNQGADINVKDYKEKTALHRAAQAGFVLITELLLANGADTEAVDENRQTPIFDAAYHGRQDVAGQLIAHGVNLEHEDRLGRTVLFIAARRGRVEIVGALVNAGANVSHTDAKGKTARDVVNAVRRPTAEHRSVLRLL